MKSNNSTSEKKAERVKMRKQRKEEMKNKRLAYKQARAERIALMKDRQKERREKRRERRDFLKNETREKRRERIAEERKARREATLAKREKYLAEKKAKREHEMRVRAERRAEKREKRSTPGFGGWLASVITLGVTTLALGTVLTFGWINMNGMQTGMAGGYTQSLYELNSVIDELDANLARARASTSSGDRVRVFADIAVESRNAELILERFPVSMHLTEHLSSFINKMGESATAMLYTSAKGGELTSSQEKSLEYMYLTNAKVKDELNALMIKTSKRDMLNAMSGKRCALGECFENIEGGAFDIPEGISDGPFARTQAKSNPKALENAKQITAQEAEGLAKQYFASYKVSEAACTGEAIGSALSLYNANLTTPDGEMLVQISKAGGKVVSFDSYKDCSAHNFSSERCEDIAQEFLKGLGYDNLSAVWVSEYGTTCNLSFAPEQDGAVLYPDLIKVKVCEERGIVTGMQAFGYVLNHGERKPFKKAISSEQAKESINGNMQITSARTAVIAVDGNERLCYEFNGTMDENEYCVYVDAVTGEEVKVLTVIGTAQGRTAK